MSIQKKIALLLSPVSFLSEYIEDILKPYFNQVLLISSIRHALDYMKKGDEVPDLIIGSYLLNDGDLLEFVEACRLEGIRLPPLLMVTSESDEGLIKRAIQAGVLEVINKRVLREKLKDFLFEFVSRLEIRKLRGTVLYVEDSVVYVEFIKRILAETEMTLVVYDNAKDALDYLKSSQVDILVVDFLLKGDYSGLDLIRMVRGEPIFRLMPILVVTGFDSIDRRLEFFRAGADDYILKPFTSEEFLIKVRNHIQKYDAIKTLEEQYRELQMQYLRDSLTGAYNRNVLEFVEKEINYSKRYNRPFSLIIFDIDNFKSVNDTYGHVVGDRVLVEVSKVVGSMIRNTDYFIRYGGEEFLIAMPGADVGSAVKKAEDIRRAVENLNIDGLRVTVSIGVACLSRNRNLGLQEMIEIADKAMYSAKKAGKNRVEVYKKELICDS